MVTAVSAISWSRGLSLSGVEAFPTSLSVVSLAGLGKNLSQPTITRLREIEEGLREDVSLERVLRARTQRTLHKALEEALTIAIPYYIKSGILVWRGLGHDYQKLLQLSRVSAQAIENQFSHRAQRLERSTFIHAVAGLRTLAQVGEWTIVAQEKEQNGTLPLDYLETVIFATFLTWCLLEYMTGGVANARKANLKAIAEGIFAAGQKAHQETLAAKRYRHAGEQQPWFWNPEWQKGEVEADLDKQMGRVKSFSSVGKLLHDLRR